MYPHNPYHATHPLPASTAIVATVDATQEGNRAAALLSIPPMATLRRELTLSMPGAETSPLAPHVVVKFTAWLQENNHPHRALCQEDSEVSLPRHHPCSPLSLSQNPIASCYSPISPISIHRPASASSFSCCGILWCCARPRPPPFWRNTQLLHCGRTTRSCWSPWFTAPPLLYTAGKDVRR